MSNTAGYIGLLVVMSMNVIGNVLMKFGSSTERILFGVWSWHTLLGVSFFGMGVLLYSWVLRSLTLHDAQILGSLQYVGVILASALLLGERIGPMKWVGIAFVAVGIAICLRAPEV